VELAVEQDEEALMEYLEGNEPDVATMKRCLRKGTLANAFVPIVTGTAFKNKGVQPLLDAVIDYMPSPLDVDAIKGIDEKGEETDRASSDDLPFSALAFKVANDPFVGTLTFTRVYSGVLETGTSVYNSVKGKVRGRERASERARREGARREGARRERARREGERREGASEARESEARGCASVGGSGPPLGCASDALAAAASNNPLRGWVLGPGDAN
jgi:elongation factor G